MTTVAGQEVESPKQLADLVQHEHGRFIDDLSFDAYRQADAINASGLKTFKRSPAHFWYEKYVEPRKDTPALRFGRLLHMAVLEPERLSRTIAIRPDVSLKTSAGRETLASWRHGLSPEAIEVSQAEADRLADVLQACRAHQRLSRLLAKGRRETSLFWVDEETQLECKARYDYVAEGTNIIVDIKTTTDARAQSFQRDAIKYDYGLSASHYLSGARHTGVANADKFAIVAIEKDPPFGIQLYELTPMELERSGQWYRKMMTDYAQCRRDDVWPCYEETFEPLGCPAWAPWVVPS